MARFIKKKTIGFFILILLVSSTYLFSNSSATTQTNSNSQKLAQAYFSSPVYNLSSNGLAYWWFNNVKVGDNLTITIEASTAHYWTSNLRYSNGTLAQSIYSQNAHSHIFSVLKDDNYLLEIGSDGTQFTYTIKSSHQPVPAFGLQKLTGWYWTGDTQVNSVASGDVDGDGQTEIVSAGYFNDGQRNVAQLIEWKQADLSVDRLTTWYWTGNTVVNSVALDDVDGDGQIEIVTGGYFNDGTRNVAQLIEWNGANLVVDRLTCWYWYGDTVINSVMVGDVDIDGQTEVVTGGYFNNGTINIAQLIEWNGANLAVDRLTSWYWTGNTQINSVTAGDVDNDGQTELVTGGSFFDGTRNVAQLIEWNGDSLTVDRLTSWYWFGNTTVNSIASGDADSDGQFEVVTGGCYFDGLRNIAQLIEWSGSNLAVDRLTGWYWTNNTTINSVALGDVDADGQLEMVTGGQFNDGVRDIAQLVVWSGSSMSAEKIQTWYWTGNTKINSVAVADTNQDLLNEIIAGGSFNDGSRLNSQITLWGMPSKLP